MMNWKRIYPLPTSKKFFVLKIKQFLKIAGKNQLVENIQRQEKRKFHLKTDRLKERIREVLDRAENMGKGTERPEEIEG